MKALETPSETSSLLDCTASGGVTVFFLKGEWRLLRAPEISRLLLAKLPDSRSEIVLDGAGLEELDAAAALTLMRTLAKARGQVSLRNFSPEFMSLLRLVEQGAGQQGSGKKHRRSNIFAELGKGTVDVFYEAVQLLGFVANILGELVRVCLRPKSFRLKEFAVHLETCLVDAIPVVGMMMFLIGIVVSYLFAIQAERYGGHIFVVDIIGLAICRELAPVIVAIIVAGRSGSSFTTHIGAMKINEEVDAMTVMGLSPIRVLVIPRTLALLFALPALVFVGDVVGILGGAAVAEMKLDITLQTFFSRLETRLPLKHVIVGLAKAPVFALFISIIGCRLGLNTESNARSLGLNTTSTVVQSIVSVILLNAIFAIILAELRI